MNNIMEKTARIFDHRLLRCAILLIIGLSLIFIPLPNIGKKEIGLFIIIISVIYIFYELKQKYYINFKESKQNFKSSKEKFIAYYFNKKKIKYVYEKELKLGLKTRKPDFYLPEFDVYVEYWGKWNDNFEYRKECHDKKLLYKKHDIYLVELYPDNLESINQLDWKFTERLLNILKDR